MNRLALAFVLLACCMASASLATDKGAEKSAGKILIQPLFAAGQKFSFETVLERQESRPDGTAPTLRSSGSASLEVIGRSGDGWELAWREGKPVITIEGSAPSRAAAARLAAEAADGLALRFVTNAHGVPLRILNADEYIEGLRKALNLVADTSFDPDSKALAGELVARLANPESVASGALRAPSLLLALGGSALAPGESQSGSGSLENTIGGEPFASKRSVSLAASPATAKSLSLKMTQRIDAVASKETIRGTMAKLGVPPESAAQFTVDISTEGTWTLDRESLVPSALEHVRTMKLGPLERVERHEFKRAGAAPSKAGQASGQAGTR